MDYKNMYCVIETGGSIGENSNWGHTRVSGNTIYHSKETATQKRKRMTLLYSGGYYDYHYSVKTVDWAIKNCPKFNVNEADIGDKE